MADPISSETKALTKQPKAFTLPAAPELAAMNAQLGGVPGVSEFPSRRAELKTSTDVSTEQEKQLGKLSQAEAPIMAAQQAGKQYEADVQSAVATQSREQAQDIEAGLDLVREQFPYPQFKPTQENMQSIATLFSLVGMIGVAMGGAGKMSAMGSLNAMTGMMNGWQKGRKDMWEKEKVEFDKNMAKTKSILDDAYKDADRAYKTLAYNREEAAALAGQSAAKLGSQVAKQILEKQGIERYISYLDGVKKDLRHAEDLASQEKREEKRLEEQKSAMEARFAQQDKLAKQSSEDQMKRLLMTFGQQRDLLDKRLEEQGRRRTNEDRKNDKEAMVMTQGVRSIENLQRQLRDPDIRTGLTSKLAPLLQKINSLSNTEDFETAVNRELTGNDKTTLFLKDALLETYAIERAAKGGQRLTVQDMKMVGPVLDPTNYKPETYNALLEQRRNVLYNNLQDMGLSIPEIQERSKQRTYVPYGGDASAPAKSISPQDKQALDWANANPKDPRSAQIKKRLGVQ
jgi:hypothetical protein